jgi:hypothetical protein
MNGGAMNKEVDHYIVGIHVRDRQAHVPGVQDILTRFGCSIKTRIGLHETSDNYCSPNGLILVELMGSNGKFEEFTQALAGIDGIDIKHMVFEHD